MVTPIHLVKKQEQQQDVATTTAADDNPAVYVTSTSATSSCGRDRDEQTNNPSTFQTRPKRNQNDSNDDNYRVLFPFKLFNILSSGEFDEDIISWASHGRAWKVSGYDWIRIRVCRSND